MRALASIVVVRSRRWTRHALERATVRTVTTDRISDDVVAWAASGLMALSGRPGGAMLGPPAGFVERLTVLGAQISGLTAVIGEQVVVDPLAVLAERAAIAGLTRGGATSCGGATRLLSCDDGWLAVSLARSTDWDLVAAWLELDGPVEPGEWERVTTAVAGRAADGLMDRGVLVGLPIAVVGECAPGASGGVAVTSVTDRVVGRADPVAIETLTVLDLSALWAGPLAGRVLARAGARVIKVEASSRPDGSRSGPLEFQHALNGDKESVVLDLDGADGRRRFHDLVDSADVVITSCRQRALDQLGLDPDAIVAAGRPRAWLSITGHGRGPVGRDRVAFGDDAAVAGGLVLWDEQGPCFCADAVADPLAGLAAAAAVLAALADGGRHVVDVSMAEVAAGFAGPTTPVPVDLVASVPDVDRRVIR